MEDPREHPAWHHQGPNELSELIAAELFELWIEARQTNALLTKILAGEQVPSGPGPATHLVVTIDNQGEAMPVAADIIVDSDKNAVVSGTWSDAMNQPATAPANAGPLVYGSDTPAVATVDPASGAVTPVAVGTFSGTIAAPLDNTGAPLLEADGTAFAAPAPSAPATVIADAATGLAVQVTG